MHRLKPYVLSFLLVDCAESTPNPYSIVVIVCVESCTIGNITHYYGILVESILLLECGLIGSWFFPT